MATIRKRGLRWQVQVRRQGFPALSRSFLERMDAQKWAREQEIAIDRGEPLKAVQESCTTLKDLLTRYETELSPNKRSPSDKFHLRQIRRHPIGSMPVQTLITENVARYRDDRLKSVSGSTVRKELQLLSHALKVARSEWGIPTKPGLVAEVSKPQVGKARTKRLSADELGRLSEALLRCRNPLVRGVFLFALTTGMRRGEVLSVCWADIDWKDSTAFLSITKNGESRMVPLSPAALQVLHERKRQAGDQIIGQIFPINSNAFRLAWDRVRLRAKVDDLHFHDLRHEAISRFFEIGLSVPEVALISGHKDIRMLFRYTHLKAKSVADKLDRLSPDLTKS
jgi:integrase